MRNSFMLVLLFLNYLQAADPLAIPNNRTIQLDRIQNLDQRLSALNQKIETQKAELKLLKDSISGDFDTDARLIIKNMNDIGSGFAFQEAKYFLDNQEIALITTEDSQKPVIFDNFLKEGNHTVRIEKKYLPNNKIFTYMNDKKFVLTGKTEVALKPGNTTYLDVVSYETSQLKDPLNMKYAIKLVPHTGNGRTILPVSDIPHLLPGSPVTETSLIIVSSRELEPGFKLLSQEIVLDGKRLKNAIPGTEGKTGLILFEGPVAPGKHKLEAILNFEGNSKPSFSIKYKSEFTTQPGFKTTLILTSNKKVRIEQEAL